MNRNFVVGKGQMPNGTHFTRLAMYSFQGWFRNPAIYLVGRSEVYDRVNTQKDLQKHKPSEPE